MAASGVVPETHLVWSGPAFAVAGGAVTLMTTSSVEEVHEAPVAMVQRKVREPDVVRPVIVVVGEPGVVIVAAVPLTWLQLPVPEVGELAAMVTEPVVVQMVWLEPAAAVVGGRQGGVHVYV